MNFESASIIGDMGERAHAQFLRDWFQISQAAFEACPLEGGERERWEYIEHRIAAKGSDRQRVDRVDFDILYRNCETEEERQCAYEVKTDRRVFGFIDGGKGTGNIFVEDKTLEESKADRITFICLIPTWIWGMLLYGDYSDPRIMPDYDAITISTSRLREHIWQNDGKLKHCEKNARSEAGYLIPIGEARLLSYRGEYIRHRLHIAS